MSTDTRTRPRHATRSAARLTIAAGWSVIAIAVLHTAVFAVQAPWGDWFGGSLRTADPDMESAAIFWALPGGIVVPAVLMGLLTVRLGREGRRLAIGYGAALFAWAACCLWMIGPSGFILLLVPAGLLVAAALKDRGGRAEAAAPATST